VSAAGKMGKIWKNITPQSNTLCFLNTNSPAIERVFKKALEKKKLSKKYGYLEKKIKPVFSTSCLLN
jgi:hypothetical protein